VAHRKRFWFSLLGNVLILFLVSSAGPPRNNTTSSPKLDGDPQGIKPLTLECDDGETQNLMSSKEDSTLAILSVLPDHEYETALTATRPRRPASCCGVERSVGYVCVSTLRQRRSYQVRLPP
jgi:hypothetical protein